jgi:hypothetical protein
MAQEDIESVNKDTGAIQVEKVQTNDVLTEDEKKLVKRAT